MFSLLVVVAVFAGASSGVVPQLDPVVANPALHLDKHAPSPHLSRIINGDNALPGEFPHQLTLLRNGYHTCGAALIHRRWAVTAAHCVDGASANNFAVAGNFINFNSPGNYFYYGVVNITMHDDYNIGNGAFPNDVALLALPFSGSDLDPFIIDVAVTGMNFDYASCYISGWGNTEDGSTNVLKKAEVTVLDEADCKSEWGSSNIVDQHICVMGLDGLGRGSCNGDSGGPLTCGPYLAGVTSWGRTGCFNSITGQVEYPSVYARISYFYSWIQYACGNCLG